MLKNLTNDAPRSLPLMRLYNASIAFNEPAARLLGFKDGDYAAIMKDDRDGLLYVANSSRMKQSYPLFKRCKTFLIRNAPLARKIADSLEGPGTYKIDPGASLDYMEQHFYNIFKKKYGKD